MNNSGSRKLVFRVTTVPVALYKLLKGQLRFLQEDFDVKCICSEGDYIDDLRREEGVDVIPVEIKREISLWNDIKALYRLWKIFRNYRPDIVHSHTPKAGLLAMLAAKLAGVKIRIHTYTGVRFETATGLLRIILMTMDRITCACATEIIPEGDGVKNTLCCNNITKKPLKKIANGNINGIDLQYFHPQAVSSDTRDMLRRDLNINEDDFVLSFVGRIVKDKGMNELIEVFDSLSKSNPKLKLILVGPFEERLDPVSKESLKILRENENIIMVGLQQDVRPYISISNVFVFPSYREGFPNVVMQAGALGVPCIVTDINGCNEIIVDGENGIIIPSKDKSSLEKAILTMMTDNSLLQRIKRNSREMIASRYSRELVWNGVKERYNNLLK